MKRHGKTHKKAMQCTHTKTETETKTLKIVDKKNCFTIFLSVTKNVLSTILMTLPTNTKTSVSLKKNPKHARGGSYFGYFFLISSSTEFHFKKSQDTFFPNAMAIYRCKKWFNPHHNHN